MLCFHAISPDWTKRRNKIDPINYEKGECFILIYNIIEFKRRVNEKLNRMKLKPNWGLLQYYNENETQEKLTPFFKSKRFEHEHEYRLFIRRKTNSAFILNIGPLTDVAAIGPVSLLDQIGFNEDTIEPGLIRADIPKHLIEYVRKDEWQTLI